jgi:hypothetical protein
VARGWSAGTDTREAVAPGAARTGEPAEGPDGGGPARRRLALGVGALLAAQLAVGPLTILLLQPPALRVFHLFLADLLWLGVVFLGATLLTPE